MGVVEKCRSNQKSGCPLLESQETSLIARSTILDHASAHKYTGALLKKALQSHDLSTEFVKWRDIAADRNQWRAVCGSKMPSASKETSTFSRQDIWAEFRYDTLSSKVQTFTRKFQINK
jgi:hypothetical protein